MIDVDGGDDDASSKIGQQRRVRGPVLLSEKSNQKPTKEARQLNPWMTDQNVRMALIWTTDIQKREGFKASTYLIAEIVFQHVCHNLTFAPSEIYQFAGASHVVAVKLNESGPFDLNKFVAGGDFLIPSPLSLHTTIQQVLAGLTSTQGWKTVWTFLNGLSLISRWVKDPREQKWIQFYLMKYYSNRLISKRQLDETLLNDVRALIVIARLNKRISVGAAWSPFYKMLHLDEKVPSTASSSSLLLQ